MTSDERKGPSPAANRLIEHTSLWVAGPIVLTLLVCTAVSLIHVTQKRALESMVLSQEQFRQARIELAKGYLYVSLAGEPDVPFDRGQGLALLKQSVASMQQALDRNGLPATNTAAMSDFRKKVASFSVLLGRYSASSSPDPALDTQLRVAFYGLERQADVVDARIQEHMRALSSRYDAWFYGLLSAAACLLALFCAGVIVVIRARRQAIAALRSSEARYRQLFGATPVPLCFVNGKGELVSFNERFKETFGFGAGDIPTLDKWWESACPDLEYRKEVTETWARSVGDALKRDGDIPPHEYQITCRNGEVRSVLVSGVTLEKDVLAIFFDITDRKRAEAQRQLLSAAIEQSQEGVVVTDVEGDIQYANRAMERMTGYPREELIGRNPRILKSGLQDAAFYEALWGTILAGRVWRGRLTNRRKDGGLYIEEATISPLRDEEGDTSAFVATKRDVTQEVELSRKLEEAKKLETVGMIAGAVAHEVRNPLFAITTIATALQKNLSDRPEFGEYVKHIQGQTRRLNALMEDLLTLGRPIDSGEFVPLDLKTVLSESRDLVAAGGGDAGALVFEMEDAPLPVFGIAGKLHQVFVNLWQNALSFTPPEGMVHVRAVCDDGAAAVTVTDEGPGIPGDFLPKLFTPFNTMRKGGTGLGLAIVKQVVMAHGGSVEAANNDPAPGATFTVRLPLAE